MQTFLPYASFQKSAACLDRQRLGKQRLEARSIIQCLLGLSHLRWSNHPAVRMWKGHEKALALYGIEVCLQWRKRGYRDCQLPWFQSVEGNVVYPPWLGLYEVHASHRSCLLAKKFDWYSQWGWDERPTGKVDGKWPYVWPTSSNPDRYNAGMRFDS
jgi:hypothetical protein